MKLKSNFFIFAFLLSIQLLSADELFPSCFKTKNDTTYSLLNTYLLANNISALTCQKLNNKEYIYTEQDNFYYCNFEFANAYEYCQENEQGVYYNNLNLQLQFYGKNNKKFVLFKTEDLKFGIYQSWYSIFFFTPKKVNQKGYEIVSLYDSNEYFSENNVCDYLNDNDYAKELKDYKIINRGESNVGISFIQKVTSCKTKESKIITIEYTWNGKTFELSK
ncbi:MAG TPA: hypothetical protein VJA83_02945 [Sulfuricurvum sp.]|nr:hypothetical protein [Sulfuricurvum sp.]